MGSYRSRSRILLDLLHALEQPCSLSALLRRVNLSHPRLRDYLAESVAKKWAEETASGWRITEAGRQARRELDRMAKQMADFGLTF